MGRPLGSKNRWPRQKKQVEGADNYKAYCMDVVEMADRMGLIKPLFHIMHGIKLGLKYEKTI